jgi:hypothetical protein
MKKLKLMTADFVKVSRTLTDEAYHGHAHLDICEGLGKLDPFIGNYAPVFFTYTFYGHLYSAQMYAIKLFDAHGDAFTLPKFLEMAKLRASKFPHASEGEVLESLAEADVAVAKLQPTIKELRRRRNDFLAHISEKLVLRDPETAQSRILTIEQVREVLYDAGKIVNGLMQMWEKSVTQLRPRHTDDYEKIISIVKEYLCAQAKAHDVEYAKYGGGTAPRPMDCP